MPAMVHPMVLRELAEMLTKPLSIYQQYWLSRELPFDWKLPDVLRRDRRRIWDLQACQSDLGVGVDHGAEIVNAITQQVQDKQQIRNMDL